MMRYRLNPIFLANPFRRKGGSVQVSTIASWPSRREKPENTLRVLISQPHLRTIGVVIGLISPSNFGRVAADKFNEPLICNVISVAIRSAKFF